MLLWMNCIFYLPATCHIFRTLNKQTRAVLFSDQAQGEGSNQPLRNLIVSGKSLSSSTGPCRRLNNTENRTGRKQRGTNVCMRPAIHPAATATATVALTHRYTKRCGVSITHKTAAASNHYTPTLKHTRHMHCSLLETELQIMNGLLTQALEECHRWLQDKEKNMFSLKKQKKRKTMTLFLLWVQSSIGQTKMSLNLAPHDVNTNTRCKVHV